MRPASLRADDRTSNGSACLRLTLAITTYERPDALAAVLESVTRLRDLPDEIVVADDGSGPATRAVVERYAQRLSPPTLHVVQPHAGFRVARLRNLAIARASGDYIVFVDGDMVLHAQFIADHRAAARPRTFVQGVRIPLDRRRTAHVIANPDASPTPLTPGLGKLRRLYALRAPRLGAVMARAANGFIAIKSCNQGYWRSDLVDVNGFNEGIVGWGPEDKELAVRLVRAGVERRTLLFGGIAWHLHHAPASRDRAAVNLALLNATRASTAIRCERGLDEHLVL